MVSSYVHPIRVTSLFFQDIAFACRRLLAKKKRHREVAWFVSKIA
jgi:hypothetical protein